MADSDIDGGAGGGGGGGVQLVMAKCESLQLGHSNFKSDAEHLNHSGMWTP